MNPDRVIAIISIVVGVITSLVTLVVGVNWGQNIQQRSDEARKGEKFEVKVKACIRGNLPPLRIWGHFMAIDLTLLNMGEQPVYVTSASLVDSTGYMGLDFMSRSEAKPVLLQPGEPFHATIKMGERKSGRQAEENLLRNVCRRESTFVVQTARGGKHTFKAVDVCGQDIEGWPDYLSHPADPTTV